MNTPTHVFGFGAREYAAAQGWTDAVIGEGSSLAIPGGVSGVDPLNPRVIYLMPGRYEGVNAYLGKRPNVHLIGTREAVLVKTRIAQTTSQLLNVVGISLENTGIGVPSYVRGDVETYLGVHGCRMYGWAKEDNGISNAHYANVRGLIHVTGNEFEEVGGLGNTTHAMYIEGRPHLRFVAEDNFFNGGRGCSAIKSTCFTNEFRRNRFKTIGPHGLTIHTMIDAVATSNTVVADNEFEAWFPADYARRAKGMKGLHTAAIFIRQRQNLCGDDTPNYPDVSWEPPVSSSEVRGDPGGGFSGGPETFVNPAYWEAARAWGDRADPANPFTKKWFISGNSLVHVEGSTDRPLVRNDGTAAVKEIRQFGPGRALRVTPNWFDRSVTFLCNNRSDRDVPNQFDRQQFVAEVEPGAIHPRALPEHFPLEVQVPFVQPPPPPPQMPEWFRR